MVFALGGRKTLRKILGIGRKPGKTIVACQEDFSGLVVDVKLFTTGGEAESYLHFGIRACCHD